MLCCELVPSPYLFYLSRVSFALFHGVVEVARRKKDRHNHPRTTWVAQRSEAISRTYCSSGELAVVYSTSSSRAIYRGKPELAEGRVVFTLE